MIQFQRIIEEMNEKPLNAQQDYCLAKVHEWLKEQGDEELRGVIAHIKTEMEGHMNHPTVIAMIEMIEGMLALRQIMR